MTSDRKDETCEQNYPNTRFSEHGDREYLTPEVSFSKTSNDHLHAFYSFMPRIKVTSVAYHSLRSSEAFDTEKVCKSAGGWVLGDFNNFTITVNPRLAQAEVAR